MARCVRRLGFMAFLLGGLAAASVASADNWSDLIVTSPTLPITQGYLCQGAGSIEIGCPSSAPYLTSGGLLGIGTTDPQTALEVSGTVSATHFIGDGSGLTGISADGGDRITSGTTSMVAYTANSYVSVTQGGVNTAYFHPSLGLVALGVSTTGGISGTTGYFSDKVNIGQNVAAEYNLDVRNMSGQGTVVGGFRGEDGGSSGQSYVVFNGLRAAVGYDGTRGVVVIKGYSGKGAVIDTDNTERFRITYSGNVGIGTATPSVPLEVSGTVSATHFVGDGSGLTGIGTASGDRITSGTTSMVAVSATGYVSLTQASTNTGWFDPTRGLVTLGVSTTGPISATEGYFSGNVGIGTSSPNTALVVSANNTSGWNQAITLNSYDNGTGMVGGGLRLASMRGTAATPTNTLSGDQIGSVNFSGYWTGKANAYFGQNESRVSIIARASEDWNSSANTGTFLTFNTTGNGSGSSYERMRIDASGNIGIGTKAPAVPLDVSGAIKVAGDGAESCTSATLGTFRRNPATNRMQLCYLPQ